MMHKPMKWRSNHKTNNLINIYGFSHTRFTNFHCIDRRKITLFHQNWSTFCEQKKKKKYISFAEKSCACLLLERRVLFSRTNNTRRSLCIHVCSPPPRQYLPAYRCQIDKQTFRQKVNRESMSPRGFGSVRVCLISKISARLYML